MRFLGLGRVCVKRALFGLHFYGQHQDGPWHPLCWIDSLWCFTLRVLLFCWRIGKLCRQSLWFLRRIVLLWPCRRVCLPLNFLVRSTRSSGHQFCPNQIIYTAFLPLLLGLHWDLSLPIQFWWLVRSGEVLRCRTVCCVCWLISWAQALWLRK